MFADKFFERRGSILGAGGFRFGFSFLHIFIKNEAMENGFEGNTQDHSELSGDDVTDQEDKLHKVVTTRGMKGFDRSVLTKILN